MEPKTYNLKDDDVDPNEIMCDIFDYLLKLDGPTQTDDEIKETKKEKMKWIDKPAMITIETIDDSKKSIYNKLYFNGECDSNQTRYEFLSNHCKISTVSKSDKVGLVLHTFLRQVIDDQPEHFFLYVFEGYDNEEKGVFTVPEMVDRLAKHNSQYSHICDTRLGLYYERQLSGYKREINIHRFLPDVDVWDIYRIATALGIWDPEEQYKDIKM